MGIIAGLIGIGLLLWAFRAGIGTRESNRAEVFSGRVGSVVNGVVLVIAAILIWWGFF